MTVTAERCIPPVSRKLSGFELQIPAIPYSDGDVLAIHGRSGCGKSTYLRAICLPNAALLPQFDDVADDLTVQQNLELGALADAALGRNFRRMRARIEEFLGLMDLEPYRYHVAKTLSGGERRRVAVARTLITNRSWLLLDEPFNGLGRLHERRLVQLLDDTRLHRNLTIVVSHDLILLSSFADRVVMIEGGRQLGIVDPRTTTAECLSPELANAVGVTNVLEVETLQSLFEVHPENALLKMQGKHFAFWRHGGCLESRAEAAPTHPQVVHLLRRKNTQWKIRHFSVDGELCARIHVFSEFGDCEIIVRSRLAGTGPLILPETSVPPAVSINDFFCI